LLGVDVGGTNIKLGLVHPVGHVIARTYFPTNLFVSSKTKLISALAQEIKIIINKQGLKHKTSLVLVSAFQVLSIMTKALSASYLTFLVGKMSL